MQNNEKTLARLAAIQTIYSNNIDDGQDLESILELTFSEISKEHGSFKRAHAKKLVDLVIENEDSLNSLIGKLSDKADKTGINALITSILQVSLTELMYDEKTDRNIIVSEYVNLTAEFFNEKETGFVNAVLDKYVKG